MKSFLIIGMGTFGHHLCKNLSYQEKCEIMVVDQNAEKLEDILNIVESAKVADCTDENVLKSFDVDKFDTCFVCVGSNFQNSIQITSLLKDLGALKVVSLAQEDIQAKLLLRNGADRIILPEKDSAERIAITEGYNGIFDYIELSEEYGIYEIMPNPKWIGKTLRELNFRQTYNMSLMAVKKDDIVQPLPTADYVFNVEEHLIVISARKEIKKIL